MDDSLLPGGAEPPRSRGNGQFVAIVIVVVVVVAVIGLLAGALWGRSSSNAGGVTPAPPTVRATGPTSPAPATGPTSPASPTSPPTSPAPDSSPTTPSGGFPPAPATSQQVSKKWAVGNWRITNTAGVIGMEATVTNRAGKTRSGDLTMYLYVDGDPLARLGAVVTDVPAGASIPVTFTSDDPWGPGTKTLLLVAN